MDPEEPPVGATCPATADYPGLASARTAPAGAARRGIFEGRKQAPMNLTV